MDEVCAALSRRAMACSMLRAALRRFGETPRIHFCGPTG